MFAGGISRGTSTLLLGPTGSGKSTIALQYASTAAKRGDKVSVYIFDEVLRTALDRAESLGMPLRKQIESGLLEISQIDPAELSPGELIDSIRKRVEEQDVRVVVIDSLNGFQYAMPGETDLNLHLHELIAFLNQRGVVTFLVVTQLGLIGSMIANVDVSYLADNVLLLRYFESKGTIRQAVSVVKQRSGAHERALREFSFGPDGITIGKPLINFRGILTGVPDFVEAPE